MIILYVTIGMYGFVSTILTCLALAQLGWVWDEVYNPITIYKYYKVNYFGCLFLTLLFHIIFPLPAPIFWLYKLCTVGRKK
jgi:hypothetical protein